MGYIYWDSLPNVVAFTSDRNGGFSKAPYNSFNQAYQVGDDKESVILNRTRLCADHHLTLDRLITAYQQHTDIIMKVDSSMLGKGQDSFESGVGPCDALYTFESGLALGVFHADCVPVFFASPKHHLVGIIHAGKTGTLKKVVYKSLTYIIKEEHIDPNDIYVHLGPALTFSHCSLDMTPEEFIQIYGEDFLKGMKSTSGVHFLDVPLLNVIQARDAGIPSINISVYEGCTFESEALFFSYKRDKTTGRHLSVIFQK